ncbi:hypothetical protein PAECIP111891_07060 [Paenibacillus allorhizoplanae]|uniref:Uncharacterized protein n=1 Tax=Paenibacillus allorhizoplanae TaxID=2905648 RepID=A0ABM9CZB8_9BACL|nr:hypothetical protein [Paenibacillus allorhizoplanae]CAH1232618.1 hypothetical protein PAECIP111891_07060 [Paenibacillus allorhizoplanae]
MADKFVCRLYFPSEKLSSQDVINTFFDYKFFTATHMKGIGRGFNSTKYKQKVFLEGLGKKLVSNESRYTIVLEDEMINSSIGLYKRSNLISMLSITIAENSFAEFRTEILRNIDLQFQKLRGIVCYANSMMDGLLQNSQNPDTYIRNNKSLDNIKLIPSPGIKDQQIIDIEQFPGHSHLINDLWFGTGWKMWFGSHYFQYIPRDLLVSFNNC